MATENYWAGPAGTENKPYPQLDCALTITPQGVHVEIVGYPSFLVYGTVKQAKEICNAMAATLLV